MIQSKTAKSASIPSVSTPSFEVVDSTDDDDDGIDWDRAVIEDVLVEAFQKLDTDFDEPVKPVKHIQLNQNQKETDHETAQSPHSTSSWTVVEEEAYDEIWTFELKKKYCTISPFRCII